MRALIAGAGPLGARTARVLTAAGNDITLIDPDEERIRALAGHTTARLVTADACQPGVLEHAGALTADLVIAATERDEDNLVISLLAKRDFAVPRVAARVNDDENAWLFDRRWGVDVAIPATAPLVSLIEEATGAADTVALLRLSRAGVTVIETTVTPRSRTAGRTLADVVLPAGAVIATIIRDEQPIPPAPQTRLRPGDTLLLVSHTATEQEVHAAFQ